MTEAQHPQPPPDDEIPYQEERHRWQHSKVPGWVRILEHENGKCEVYWKGRSDVAVLMAHSLNKRDAEAMVREIKAICRRYDNIPLVIEEANVNHREVKTHEQTQGHSQGGVGQVTENGG